MRITFRTFTTTDDTVNPVCDATDLFDGRGPRSADTWPEVYKRFERFVRNHNSVFGGETEVLLDCHTTAAMVAGYLISWRVRAWPLGPRPELVLQRPERVRPIDGPLWDVESNRVGRGDIVVARSGGVLPGLGSRLPGDVGDAGWKPTRLGGAQTGWSSDA